MPPLPPPPFQNISSPQVSFDLPSLDIDYTALIGNTTLSNELSATIRRFVAAEMNVSAANVFVSFRPGVIPTVIVTVPPGRTQAELAALADFVSATFRQQAASLLAPLGISLTRAPPPPPIVVKRKARDPTPIIIGCTIGITVFIVLVIVAVVLYVTYVRKKKTTMLHVPESKLPQMAVSLDSAAGGSARNPMYAGPNA